MEVGQKLFTDRKPSQLVYLELGLGNGGMLLSLSEDGFRFRAVAPVRLDVQMPFAFSLDGKVRIEGHGLVVEIEDDGKSGGMRFTDVSDQFRASLQGWVAAESAESAPGREDTQAVSTHLDVMEQIRRELRSAPARPQPTRTDDSASSPSTSAASLPGPKESPIPAQNVPAKKSPPAAKESRLAPAHPERKTAPPSSPQRPLNQLFSTPIPRAAEQANKAAMTSAFLKPNAEFKSKNAEPPLSAPAATAPTLPALTTTQIRQGNAGLNLSVTPPAAPVEQRPYIPPLESSFEQAWEQAKLTAPPDSPRLTRAAAGGIIAVALAVILGALAYNFRQDIGALLIQLGRSISGESQPPSAAPVERPQAGVGSNESAEGQKSPATSPDLQNVQSNSRDNGPATGLNTPPSSLQPSNESLKNTSTEPPKSSPSSTVVPKTTARSAEEAKGLVAPATSAVRPVPTLVAPSVAETATKPAETIESPTGQDEFNAARDMLRGPNRPRDLAKAIDLLWIGVRKGYVPAEVTLADLFRRGDGVPKNCDQASVLLTAASKKGSTDARKMLEQMVEQGCTD